MINHIHLSLPICHLEIVTITSIKATIVTFLAVIIGYLNLGYFFSKYFSKEQIGLLLFLIITSTLLDCVFQMNLTLSSVKYRK